MFNMNQQLIDKIAKIPENNHLLYLSNGFEEVMAPFIQTNRNRWWNEQSNNSATFYFCQSEVTDAYGSRFWGKIAQIMIFIQNPTRIRLHLLHMRVGEPSVSIQQDRKELYFIHPQEISLDKLSWQNFEFDQQLEPGKYDLELVIQSWPGWGRYCLRHIRIEFLE